MQKAVKVIRIHKIFSVKVLMLIIAVLFFAGCGIKSYPYLSPPQDNSIAEPLEGDKLFKFFNYTGNNTNYFLGYEIYYKFYSTDIDSSQYESETDIIELNPKEEKLISLGYKRLYNKIDVFSKPLIPISVDLAEQAVSIEIDFRFLTDTIYPTISYAENTIEAARYVQKTDDVQDTVYNFNNEAISSEYSDISSTIFTEDTETLYLSLYVLSYGKYEVFNELFSDAAHLGKITVETENVLF